MFYSICPSLALRIAFRGIFLLSSSQAPVFSKQEECSLEMSRHHNRFERDYRGAWERRDRGTGPGSVANSSCNTTNSCGGANSRPGLLPLPVISSLLPTPVSVAMTTCSGDLVCKRIGLTSTTATAKVRLAFCSKGDALLKMLIVAIVMLMSH